MMANAVSFPAPPATLSRAPLSVAKVSLFHFRNYGDLCLNFEAAPVVLTGANGSGKTNLLEAISLLAPGRGFRRATMAEFQNQNTAQPWAISVGLNTAYGALNIGIGRDPKDLAGDKRLIHIDGKNARGQSVLSTHVAMAWVTPDMDRVLVEGPGARRRLLDRLVYSFDPTHSARVHRYEKALRERSRLLREGIADATWLGALEDEMAQTGVAIAAARNQLVMQLRAAIVETSSAFPRADIALRGVAEESLEDQAALLVEDKIRAELARTRSEDRHTGTCAIGPHRSDLVVRHRTNNCPVDLCSTGEQKALLVAIMIAYLRTLIRHRAMTPLFLLDDGVAHLDSLRRDALFEEIRGLGVQAWLTGTDRQPFAPLMPYAQHRIVEQGHIRWV